MSNGKPLGGFPPPPEGEGIQPAISMYDGETTHPNE